MRTTFFDRRWYLFPLAVIVAFVASLVLVQTAAGDPGNPPSVQHRDISGIQAIFSAEDGCDNWTVMISSAEIAVRTRGQADRQTWSAVDVYGFNDCDHLEYFGSADLDPVGVAWDLTGGTLAGSVVVEVWAAEVWVWDPYLWGNVSVDFDLTLTATGETTDSRHSAVDHYWDNGVRHAGVSHERSTNYPAEVAGTLTTDLPVEFEVSTDCGYSGMHVNTYHQLGWWLGGPEVPSHARRPI